MPKQTKSTPAKKVVKTPAEKKTVAKKVAAKVAAPVVAPAKKVAPKKVAAKKTATKKTAAPKKAAAKKEPVVTTVIAKIDAGFGNQVYIRGNSSGLTWDAGTLMTNAGSDEWVWKSTVVTSEVEFKVLINDSVWSIGPNGVVFPGATVVFSPSF